MSIPQKFSLQRSLEISLQNTKISRCRVIKNFSWLTVFFLLTWHTRWSICQISQIVSHICLKKEPVESVGNRRRLPIGSRPVGRWMQRRSGAEISSRFCSISTNLFSKRSTLSCFFFFFFFFCCGFKCNTQQPLPPFITTKRKLNGKTMLKPAENALDWSSLRWIREI